MNVDNSLFFSFPPVTFLLLLLILTVLLPSNSCSLCHFTAALNVQRSHIFLSLSFLHLFVQSSLVCVCVLFVFVLDSSHCDTSIFLSTLLFNIQAIAEPELCLWVQIKKKERRKKTGREKKRDGEAEELLRKQWLKNGEQRNVNLQYNGNIECIRPDGKVNNITNGNSPTPISICADIFRFESKSNSCTHTK